MTELHAGPAVEPTETVQRSTVTFQGRDGVDVLGIVHRPIARRDYPAVVVVAEGTGTNRFIERVGAALAARDMVALIVDPYRDDGPPDPENYEDFDTLMAYINALDFVQASTDVRAAVQCLRGLEDVDASRVAVWGYCTGATLAWLGACLDPQIAAAVLFYPSQPVFDSLGDRTPVHPMDLSWGLACPTLFLYGDNDVVLPADRLTELRRRLTLWHVYHEIAIYPGAGHAFCSEAPLLFHHDAAEDGWRRALAFAESSLRAG